MITKAKEEKELDWVISDRAYSLLLSLNIEKDLLIAKLLKNPKKFDESEYDEKIGQFIEELQKELEDAYPLTNKKLLSLTKPSMN